MPSYPRLEIRSDGTWIEDDNIKFEINPYDPYALEEALRIKDADEAEVVAMMGAKPSCS